MKVGKTQIIQTNRGNQRYYLSIIEKENESGIMFNERVFFLMAGHHIGYISGVKMNETPEQINFQKPKTTVLMTNIKSIVINVNNLSIKFYLIDGNKKSERTWILRMENEELSKKWYDLLQREKIGLTSSKALSPKKSEISSAFRLSPKRVDSPEKKKDFEIVRHLELSENGKQQKEFKEIGTAMSPKNAQIIKIEMPKITPEEKLNSIMSESIKPKHDNADTYIASTPASSQSLSFSKREMQQPQKPHPHSPKTEIKHVLVNSKYLNRDRSEQEKLHKEKDYLQRTQELIRSFDQGNTTRIKEKISVLREIEQIQIESPKFEKMIKNTTQFVETSSQIPWTFKYIKYGHLIFQEFENFTRKLMHQLIADQSLSRHMARFKPKLVKNNIHYFDINDMEVKLAFIGLQDIQTCSDILDTERICNKKSIKILENEFNNFKALYEYLGVQEKLKVPLVSLCAYNGFVALFKASSKHLKKTIRFKQIQYELSQLQKRSKIHKNFIDSISNVIIQLDQNYYDGLKREGDENLSFNLYVIQQIDEFLLPDLITDNPNEKLLILRKELIDNYRIDATSIKKDLFLLKENWNKSGYSKQLQNFSKNILIAISDAIIEMDSFNVYFLNSKEFSNYLHSKGINIRYLGHLYENLKGIFQKRFVMTEIAARSCKSLFRKTLQDVVLGEESIRGQELHCKVCDFFNCVVGNTFETAAIWKVLSTHANSYFGFELNFDQIDRGHFVISLIENCKLQVNWQKIKPDQAFKSSIFFSENNLIGIKEFNKSYQSIFSKEYVDVVKILEREEIYAGFQSLVDGLNLKTETIPNELNFIQPQIKKYLSFFISPEKSETEYEHLKLYESEDRTCPSRLKFDQLLMQIKWALKLKDREQYIKICDYYIRIASKYYGEFHPIFSELYELFSAYHLTNSEYEDAITFAKSSLVNILKICGTNHEKTSQCYYHLALCYIKCNKRDEGIAHIKKSLSIFESNNRTQTVPYAIMQVKLALLYLNQNQVEECVKRVINSLAVFQAKAAESPGSFQDEITECLQMLNRSYELLHCTSQARQLLQQCQLKLKRTQKPENFEKILKIYLYPIFSTLSQETASNYLDIISHINIQPNEQNCELAFKLLRERIVEESFIPNLSIYLEKLQSIEQHIREKDVLREWQNFTQVYQRQTVKDFVSLTVELLTFLGEGYISGTLREAL